MPVRWKLCPEGGIRKDREGSLPCYLPDLSPRVSVRQTLVACPGPGAVFSIPRSGAF